MKAEDELMVITAEECGELIQVVSKILRFGASRKNTDMLVEELGDVQCMIDLIVERGYVSKEAIEKRVIEKRQKLKKYSSILIK